MPKQPKQTKKTPKRLMKAHTPAISLTDELAASTEMLQKQRTKQNEDYEYALVATTTSVNIKDVNDEFTREYHFSEQAKMAAIDVIARLKELDIPTEMPATYKGDMVKNIHQMAKIRDNLKSKKEAAEKSEKMKKLRELKKMGKKIQDEVLKKRSKDKKDFLEKVKKRPVSELFND